MGLIAHYRLNGDARDSVGNNHGIENNSEWTDEGKLGGAVDFRNVNSRISGETGWDIIGDFSYSFWAIKDQNSDSSIGGLVGNHWHSSGPTGANIYFRGGNLMRFAAGDGTDRPSNNFTTDFDTNQWNHYAVTCKDGFVTVYQNNKIQLKVQRDIKQDPSRPWCIGRWTESYGSQYYLNGRIDDVRIYDHALSQREVRDLSLGLVGHWKFDQDATDSSGQGNDGVVNGATHVSDSKVGSGCYQFDGVDDYISLNDDIYIDDSNSWSISFWAYQSPSTDRVMIIGGQSNKNRVYSRGNGTFWRVHFDDNNDVDFDYGSDWRGNWHHHTFSCNGTDVSFYVNGVLEDTKTPTSTAFNINRIGEGGYDQYRWEGKIDDVRIYSTALTEQQVKEIYEQRASIDDKGTLHVNELKDSGWTEDFSSGNLDNWTVHDSDFEIKTDNVYSGQYSAGIETNSTNGIVLAETYIPTSNPEKFSFRWYDKSAGRGGGFSLKDDEGDEIIGLGSDNTEWFIIDSNGPDAVKSKNSGYEVWTYFELIFDWANGKYDFYGETETGVTGSQSGDLKKSTNVSTIAIQSADPQVRSNGWSSGWGQYIWYDDIELVPKVSLSEQGTFSGNFSEVGPADGLVAWYPLIGDTQDYAGNNDGTNNGATPVADGYEFDGQDDYITVTNDTSLSTFTVSFWVYEKQESYPYSTVFKQGNFQIWDDYGWRLRNSNGGTTNRLSHPFDQWIFICFTVESGSGNSTVIGYFNGQEERNDTLNSESVITTDNIEFGSPANYYGDWLGGTISDVRIYNRALTEQEITTLYNMTKDNGPLVSMTDTTVNTANEIKEVIA